MNQWSALLAAFSFMTRLAPVRVFADEDISRSVVYFPVTGFVLGCVLLAPFYAGLFYGKPWIQAWLLLGGSLWITRGLHWDGWADLFDAWGSCARGERFWEIIKDSHVGAFGVIALVMGLCGQLILFHAAFERQAYAALLLGFIFGRCLCAVTAFCGGSLFQLARAGQGQLFLAKANRKVLILVVLQTLLFAFLSEMLVVLLLACAIALPGVYAYMVLARREKGLNGDFLGTAVIWGELCALLAWAATASFF